MPLLPYERFTIETRLTPDQVRRRLSAQVRPPSRKKARLGDTLFEGDIDAVRFEINQVPGWWSDSRPIIAEGRVHPAATGSTVQVLLRCVWSNLIGIQVLLPTILLSCVLIWYSVYFWGFILLVLVLSFAEVRSQSSQIEQFLHRVLESSDPIAPGATPPARPLPTRRLSSGGAGPAPIGLPASPLHREPRPPVPTAGADHDTQRLP